MLSFLVSCLPWSGLVAVVAAIYFRGQAQAWKDKWAEANKEALIARSQLRSREEDINIWHAQASAAKLLAIQARNDANQVQAKYDKVIAHIQDDPTIPTPDWLAGVAKSLKEQVAG